MSCGIVFDFDLTLVDSRQGIWRTMTQLAREEGLTLPTYEQVTGSIGRSLESSMEDYWGAVEPHWITRYREIFSANGYEGCTLIPGVAQALRLLRDRGYSLAVATNRLDPEEIACACGVDRLVDCIVGTSGKPHKPDPFIILESFRLICQSVESGFYVGDTIIDMEAGRRSGAFTIGVTTGQCNEQTLKEFGAKAVLSSVAALPAWLEARA